jgi:hypothetical protein
VLEGESGGVAEGWERRSGHGLASFSAAGTTCDAGPSLRAVCEEVAGNRGSETRAGAIRHPRVQIEEGAGVGAFLMRQPWLLPSGGYGSVAPEADRIAASILMTPVLKVEAVRGELKIGGSHKRPAFTRRNALRRYGHSTLRLPIRLRIRCVLGTGPCPGWGRRAYFVCRRAARRALLVPK